ncbi:MAG TPA: immunoglobulin domain-containing protein, partial [Verrucomicrobiota bacterium]|nr:immunoglobulin domain-containing protein [Verrucomicrobiota bacterium]
MINRRQLTVIASLALAVGVSSAQADYEATILLQNPAAYYRYNTTIDDSETDPNMGYLNLPGAQFFDAYTRGVAGPDLAGFGPENKAVEYTGGYSVLPSMNLLTEEATILAWMKTPATHPNYAGVVFNRGDGNSTITGLDLKGANTFQLGYHWNNHSSSYSYVSGLLVEPEKWNLVAMVGNSEGVRLYRGNSTGSLDSVLNAVPCAPTYLNGTMRVGRDSDAARILSSAGNPAYIDEVAIFSHALSEADIQSIFRSARGEAFAPTWARISPSYPKMFAGEGTLTAQGNGTHGSVEWYKDGEKLEEAGLTLSNPVAGVYSVKLVNTAGSLESETITVLPASAPSVTQQPQGTSRHPYGRVTFSVEVEGSYPMTYQWKLNGKDIADATSSTLNLTGLTKNQFGSYTVVVTNSEGSVTSEAAVLTEVPVVVDSFAEAIMKRNPIAFFRFDDALNDGSSEYDEYNYPITGVAKDYAGGNDGIYHNIYTHSQIEGAIAEDASKAIHFEGSQEYGGWVSTSLQVNNYPRAFTVMGWVRLSTAYNDYLKMSAGYFGQNDVLELGCLDSGTHGGWTSGIGSIYAPNDFGDGEWGLFAMVYDGTTLRLYLNGKEAGSRTGTSNFNAYRYYFNIGGGGVRSDPTVNMDFLTGDIDDVAVFDTAMTQDDLVSFWNKGRFGPGSAPIISIQPQNIQVYENAEYTHTFRVQVGGTEPFSYQWFKDGTALEGEQSTRLTVPLGAESAGNYTVVISNDYGSVTSETANAQIYPAPQENTYEGVIYGLAPHAYWRLGESSGSLAYDR